MKAECTTDEVIMALKMLMVVFWVAVIIISEKLNQIELRFPTGASVPTNFRFLSRLRVPNILPLHEDRIPFVWESVMITNKILLLLLQAYVLLNAQKEQFYAYRKTKDLLVE